MWSKLCERTLENIVEKAENAGYQHFLLFPQYFQNVIFLRVGKTRDHGVPCQLLNGFNY